MTTLLKWLRQIVLALLIVTGLALAAVWALRLAAKDDAAREARALMEQPPAVAAGDNGYAWLAFPDRRIPEAELEAALQAELAAFQSWQAGQGDRLLDGDGDLAMGVLDVGRFESPAAARYPERPKVPAPDLACSLRDPECLPRVREHADAVRAWLQADAERLALAERSFGAGHLSDPYPPAVDAPLPAYTTWRLALNAAALQAVDGDVAGASARACRMLDSARRFGRQGGNLIAKLVPMALAESSAGLLLSLQRENPGLVLPADCAPALAPVQTEDFLVCDALRHEYRMNATLAQQLDGALAGWHPNKLAHRLLLQDGELQQLWLAEGLAPACRDDYRQQVLAGTVPPPAADTVHRGQLRCYAAAINCLLVEIAQPAYGDYQGRLLDHAARQRLQVAAIRAATGQLPREDVAAAAASPGYALQSRDDGWELSLRHARSADEASFRVKLPAVPTAPAAPESAPDAG
jgi:hypothetical protein